MLLESRTFPEFGLSECGMKIANVVSIIALTFLAITSIVGAIPMIMDPSGGLLHMPISMIEHSPFHSFLIPGIILLVANGFLSLVILVATARRARRYEMLVCFQGFVLTGWISIEMIMMRMAAWPHYIYLGVALVLIVSGLVLARKAEAVAS
jgi:hypothetical protein